MPKKLTKKSETGDETVDKPETNEAAKPAEERGGKDKFVYVGEPNCKVAPQAQGIVNVLKEQGKKGCTRKELVVALEGRIETRQPVGRILSYYQKKLIEAEAISLEKASEPVVEQAPADGAE